MGISIALCYSYYTVSKTLIHLITDISNNKYQFSAALYSIKYHKNDYNLYLNVKNSPMKANAIFTIETILQGSSIEFILCYLLASKVGKYNLVN